MDNRQGSVSEQEWVIEFHSVKYVINVTTTDQMLTLEIENFDTSERWSGEFTSHYIEEITHKAGNLKKFLVFTKMLSSSFSRDNESVFVDILTFSDLEMLKARKLGSSTGSSSSVNSHSMSTGGVGVKQYQKRYVILTYCSEFDRVHYPLPLSFEDTPNVAALRRTISRLRKELLEKAHQAQEPANEREKELRQVVSQMRQENTELKHRLRHSGQSNHNSTAANNSSFSNGGGPNTSSADVASAAAAAANSKLKKQVESLKRELQELSLAHEKLRTEAAREVSRWKLKIGSVNPSHPDSAVPTTTAAADAIDSMMIPKGVVADLKRRVLVLEQELRSERLKSTIGGARMHHAAINSRASAYNFSPGHLSRHTDRDRGGSSSVTRPTHNWARRSISADTALRMRSRGTSDAVQQRLTASTWSNPHGSASPKQAAGSRRASPRVPSSSSLGGSRFDPTAYQRQKQQLKELQSMTSKAWGVGVSSQLYRSDKHRHQSPNGLRHESGYSSANSQSSHGSRRSSRTTSTIASQQSGSDNGSRRKARRSRKTPQSKRLVDGVGGGGGGGTYRNRRGEPHHADSETDDSEVDRRAGELLARKAAAGKAKRAPGMGVASGHHQRTPLSHHKQSSSDQWREEIDSVNQDHPHSTSRANQDDDHLHSIAEQRFTELIRGSSSQHQPSLIDPLRSSVDSVVALSNEDASRILRNVSSRSNNKVSKQADMFDSTTSHVAGTTSGDHEEHRASAALDGSDSKHVSTNSSITSMNSDPRLGAVVVQRPSDGIRSSADIIITEKVGHSASKTNLRSSGGSAKSSRRNRRSFNDGLSSSVSSSINLSAESVGSAAATPRPEEEISEIDKRIQALQAYLDNARTGILSSGDRPQG